MKIKAFVFAFLLAAPFGCAHAQSAAAQDLTRFVDPRIGLFNSGSCVIGPALPFASVHLTKYDVLSEFTPSAHSVFYQFTYPKSDEASLLIDASHSIPRDIAPQILGRIEDGQVNWSADGRSVSGFGTYRGGFVWGI